MQIILVYVKSIFHCVITSNNKAHYYALYYVFISQEKAQRFCLCHCRFNGGIENSSLVTLPVVSSSYYRLSENASWHQRLWRGGGKALCVCWTNSRGLVLDGALSSHSLFLQIKQGAGVTMTSSTTTTRLR